MRSPPWSRVAAAVVAALTMRSTPPGRQRLRAYALQDVRRDELPRRVPVRRRAIRGARPAPRRARVPLRRVPSLARGSRVVHRRRARPTSSSCRRPAFAGGRALPATREPSGASAPSADRACSGGRPSARRSASRQGRSTARRGYGRSATSTTTSGPTGSTWTSFPGGPNPANGVGRRPATPTSAVNSPPACGSSASTSGVEVPGRARDEQRLQIRPAERDTT